VSPVPAIGIDLGGTKIEGIVMSPDRAVIARRRIRTPRVRVPSGAGPDDVRVRAAADEEYAAILGAIADLVHALETEAGRRCSIGIGSPGTRARASGVMKNCNTTSLNGRRLREDLEAAIGDEIRLANDADCFAISEAIDGAGAGHRTVFGVILGTGVGGGVVVDARVHTGPNGIAGEWGHVSIDPAGPPCYCGKRGCIETFLAGPGLVHDYREDGGDAGDDARAVVARATEGESRARAALDRYVERFGRAIAIVASILDPDCIVLGGGMSAIERLYTEGADAARRHVFGGELSTPILRNRHGDASGVRGAAMLWMER
jgi:fructokinase